MILYLVPSMSKIIVFLVKIDKKGLKGYLLCKKEFFMVIIAKIISFHAGSKFNYSFDKFKHYNHAI